MSCLIVDQSIIIKLDAILSDISKQNLKIDALFISEGSEQTFYQPFYDCNSNCSGTCQNSCAGSCTGACADGCVSSCEDNCEAGCFSSLLTLS